MTAETANAGLTTEKAKPTHPLMAFVPTVPGSFEAWFADWQETTKLSDKLGLLHSLTGECGWWEREELVFTLLDVADGFADSSNFEEQPAGDPYYRQKTSALRQEIAKKAFSVLCLRFFREGRSGYDEPRWWWMLEHKVLVAKVLWFLRKEGSRFRNRLYHLDSSDREGSIERQHEVFRAFLIRFAHLGWNFQWPQDCRRWDDKDVEDAKQRMAAARPQLLEVLSELNGLGWFNQQDLDEETIKMLTAMALNREYPFTNSYHYRRPETLDEAILGGSVEAQIVVLHKIKAREKRRLAVKCKIAEGRRRQARRAAELERLANDRKKLDDEEMRLSGKKS